MTTRESLLAAFGLAATGRLQQAESLLAHNEACLRTEEGLDLLARLRLRQGDEAMARRLWQHALDGGIGGPRSRAALSALASVEWRHRKAIHWIRIVALAVLLWGVGALSGFFVGRCAGLACPESAPSCVLTASPGVPEGISK